MRNRVYRLSPRRRWESNKVNGSLTLSAFPCEARHFCVPHAKWNRFRLLRSRQRRLFHLRYTNCAINFTNVTDPGSISLAAFARLGEDFASLAGWEVIEFRKLSLPFTRNIQQRRSVLRGPGDQPLGSVSSSDLSQLSRRLIKISAHRRNMKKRAIKEMSERYTYVTRICER